MDTYQPENQLLNKLTLNEYPDLPVQLAEYSSKLLQTFPGKIFELVQAIGSPLHCIFPQQFAENIASFKTVLKNHHLDENIFFAKKSNKSQHIIKVCRQQNIGIDVASQREMELALTAGITGTQISVSGPEKSSEFLQFAINHGAQIALNSLEDFYEMKNLISTTITTSKYETIPTRGKKPSVLLRYQPDSESHSRFGFTPPQLSVVLNELKSLHNQIDLLGFSFHLSGYDIGQRAQVAYELVHWVNVARKQGFNQCHQINIGGGFPLQYVEKNQWLNFIAQIKPEHFHKEQRFAGGFYPYGGLQGGAQSLNTLLSYRPESKKSLAAILNTHHIQLALEPGRALLDQVGVSVFKIQGMKYIESEKNYHIATVSGMSFSLSEQWFASEYLPSPFLLKRQTLKEPNQTIQQHTFPTAIAGNSCLECDMLTWRKIPFSTLPEVNDLLIYANTAGYQMDSNESSFHSIPILPKVAIWFENQHLHWQLDSSL